MGPIYFEVQSLKIPGGFSAALPSETKLVGRSRPSATSSTAATACSRTTSRLEAATEAKTNLNRRRRIVAACGHIRGRQCTVESHTLFQDSLSRDLTDNDSLKWKCKKLDPPLKGSNWGPVLPCLLCALLPLFFRLTLQKFLRQEKKSPLPWVSSFF